jgi:NAD(P)-dependent dehydrogenase (short-subunit alcohol dehydrogenase family)
LVRTYAGEVAQTTVRANLVNPGPLRTKMRAQAMPGEDPNALKPPDALVPDLVRMLSPDFDRNGVLFDFPTGETREFSAG